MNFLRYWNIFGLFRSNFLVSGLKHPPVHVLCLDHERFHRSTQVRDRSAQHYCQRRLSNDRRKFDSSILTVKLYWSVRFSFGKYF